MSRTLLTLRRIPFPKFQQSNRLLKLGYARSLPQHETSLQSGFRWSYLWYASVLALGVTAGLGARHLAGRLALPLPGTHGDTLILDSLSADIDQLEVVQLLRSPPYNSNTHTPLHSGSAMVGKGASSASSFSTNRDWLELDLDSGKEEDKSSMLSAMDGTRGIGVQRAFWNPGAKEMVLVVWIGEGLSGWPGIVHGGAIATVFEELIARMVGETKGSKEPSQRLGSLSITYKRPTYSPDFYILRAAFKESKTSQSEAGTILEAGPTRRSWLSWLGFSKDPANNEVQNREGSHFIEGTLESVKGDVCVMAKGTYGFIP